MGVLASPDIMGSSGRTLIFTLKPVVSPSLRSQCPVTPDAPWGVYVLVEQLGNGITEKLCTVPVLVMVLPFLFRFFGEP